MTMLLPMRGDDHSAVHRALRVAFAGGPALGLGMTDVGTDSVPVGTAVVIATSGSTGIPKRVMLSADALRRGAEATAARIGSGRWLLALPASYVAGLQVLVRSELAGTTPVALAEKFTAEAFVDATARLQEARAGELFTALVPAQIATLVAAASTPAVAGALQAYRTILVGGQALPQSLHAQATELGARLVRTYGSSETSGGCVYDGVPLDGVRVRVVDGELQIAGPMLASGYLDDDALTRRVFVADHGGTRWYRTGDLGEVEAGRVRVSGRADNVIVSGGINVSLDRVERIIRQTRGLHEAIVVGVPDERWGEASVIVVAREALHEHDEAELLANARTIVAAEVGPPARPKDLVVVEDMPQLPSGKPDRTSIREVVVARSR